MVTRKASEHAGLYTSDNRQDSIFYDNANLKVVLIFPSSEASLGFINSLQELQDRVGGDEVDSIVDASEDWLAYDEDLSRRVRFSHYKSEDSGSPAVTSRSRESQVVIQQGDFTDVVRFQSIELKECLSIGFHSCHIRGQQYCNPYQRGDPNNVLAMTPNGHHMFDAYPQSDRSIPTMRLSVISIASVPDRLFSVECNEYQDRFKVGILVEFANPTVYAFGINMKDGFTRNDENMTRETYVEVMNPNAFKAYIDFKNTETTNRGFEVRR